MSSYNQEMRPSMVWKVVREFRLISETRAHTLKIVSLLEKHKD